MNKISVAICDTDDTYRERFAAYLVERRADKFNVHTFSGAEHFLQALSGQQFDVAILGQGFETTECVVRERQIPLLLLLDTRPELLAEDSAYMTGEKEMCVTFFRYQPMDAILHEVQVLAGGGFPEESVTGHSGRLEVLGVYSPIMHEMQMPFSMVLAEKLAEQRKVLYVNLMCHSGFLEIFGLSGRYDMGDIVLRLRNKRLFAETFLKCLYESNRVNYIPPFCNPEDLRGYTLEDHLALLSFLEESTDFETLILDFGEGTEQFAEVLDTCQAIYCPMKTGYFYECRMHEFLMYLEKSSAGSVRERIHIMNLPFSAKQIRGGVDVRKQLLWSEFGDYVRSYLGGDSL